MATEAGAFKLHLGIDVGSTTVKVAVLDEDDQIVYSVYRRHHADVRATVLEVLQEAAAQFPDKEVTVAITGSGGLLLSQWLGIEFVQEVIASCIATFIFQSSNNAFASPLVGALNSLSGSPFFLYRAVQPPLLFGNSDPSPLDLLFCCVPFVVLAMNSSLSLMRYSCQIRYKVYFNIAKPD